MGVCTVLGQLCGFALIRVSYLRTRVRYELVSASGEIVFESEEPTGFFAAMIRACEGAYFSNTSLDQFARGTEDL